MADDIELSNDTRADTPGAAEAQSRFLHEAKDLSSGSHGPATSGDKVDSAGDPTNNFPSENNLMAMLDGQGRTEAALESAALQSDSDRSPVSEFDDLLPEMKKIFPKVDLDNNGYASQAELDKAMLNPNFKGREAQAVYVMRQFREGIQNCNNDEWGPENDGITLADINALARIKSTVDAGALSFDDIDSDKNGFLSPAELKTAMSNEKPNENPFLAKSAKLLFSELNDLQAASNDELGPENDGITKDDLKVYQDKIPSRSNLSITVSESFTALHNGTNTLFSDRMSNPLDSINPSAVFLGKIDDCGFMSDLASMAATDKGKLQIKDMLQDNGIQSNGVHTYTVTFPGQKNNPITVVEPTDAQKIEYAKQTMFGMWPSILEKAYAQYKSGGDNNKMPVQEVLKDSSKTLEGMQLLSGKAAKQISLESTNKELVEKTILKSLSDGNPISVSQLGHGIKFDYNSHRYAIIGYDPEKQEIVLKDTEGGHPAFAGPNKGGADGIFRLPLGNRDRERIERDGFFSPSGNFMNLDALNYVE